MLATKKLYDENSGSPQRSEKDLQPPPSLRMSRKHRPTPLDLSPKCQHLSPLDSNNPNALEEYLFSNSPATANSSVGLGMPSPAHYSQIDLIDILETNPPLTPVAPLRTAPLAPEVDVVVPVSPGFPPALHAEDTEGPIDEIFLELFHTETSFLSEIETIEAMVKEVLCPLGVVGSDWVSGVSSLRILHAGFAKELGKSDSGAITPTILQSLLEWPESAQSPYEAYISAFRLELDRKLEELASEKDVTKLTEIKTRIIPEGGEQVTLDYIFKRPLVRLRYYSKLYKYWTHFSPQIVEGENITTLEQEDKTRLAAGHCKFKVLVSTARNRVSEERIRLQTTEVTEPPKSEDLTPSPPLPELPPQEIPALPEQEPTPAKPTPETEPQITSPQSLTSPPVKGMKRSPAMGEISSPLGESGASVGWTLTDQISETKTNLTRGWSFETRPRAQTEPRPPPSYPPPPIPASELKKVQETQEGEAKKNGHERGDSVSLVRGVLKMSPSPSPDPSPSPSPTPSPPSEPEEYRLPPPKMAALRRGSSPLREGGVIRPLKEDNLAPDYQSPRLPRTPSVPRDMSRSPSFPKEPFLRSSPSLSKEPPAPIPSLIPRSPQPRSISPSRSVPTQLQDLPHFPTTPTKHDKNTPPMLPVLEFGQSPLGLHNYLKNGIPSPRRAPVDGSPLAKERVNRFASSNSLQLSPTPSPRSRSPATLTANMLSPLIDAERGRISPSPTVYTFPPRTMRLDENDRITGTRSVEDLRRLSGPRQGALSRLDHRSSGSSGSASVEDEELAQMLTTGRVLHSGMCVVHFWKKGDWHRLEVPAEESFISVESFGNARRPNMSPPKVLLRVMNPAEDPPTNLTMQHDILATASIRRDSPSEVSIGCDVPNGKKEYYLFACRDPGEADGLYHALNTGRYLVSGVSDEQLRQATSLFGRTTSFASSLATNSSVGSTISNLSLYDTPPVPMMPTDYSPQEDKDPEAEVPLEERVLVQDHKVKIFLRQDAGIWKNLGGGKLSVFTTGPEVRVHVLQSTKKDPKVIVDGRIFESGACERVARTGVAVNLHTRDGKISVYMLQSKNDKEAQIVYEAIRKGRSAL